MLALSSHATPWSGYAYLDEGRSFRPNTARGLPGVLPFARRASSAVNGAPENHLPGASRCTGGAGTRFGGAAGRGNPRVAGMKRLAMVLGTTFLLGLGSARAAEATAATAPAYPQRIPAPGGHVLIPDARARRSYELLRYAPARRVGNQLYISGVIAGPLNEEGRDAVSLTLQVRRAFHRIQQMLHAEGATFADVVIINSFHVWDGPGFKGDRGEQFRVFSAVKDEFMPAPHAAWTAVGTTGFLAPNGVVEVQMIAHIPAETRPLASPAGACGVRRREVDVTK